MKKGKQGCLGEKKNKEVLKSLTSDDTEDPRERTY